GHRCCRGGLRLFPHCDADRGAGPLLPVGRAVGVPPLYALPAGELVSSARRVLSWAVRYFRWTTAPSGPEFMRSLLSALQGAKVFIRSGWQLGILPPPPVRIRIRLIRHSIRKELDTSS